MPGSGAENYVVAANIEASKPVPLGHKKMDVVEDDDLPLCLM